MNRIKAMPNKETGISEINKPHTQNKNKIFCKNKYRNLKNILNHP